MTDSSSVYTEKTLVRAYDSDFKNQWKPFCMLQAMQEIANKHAISLGIGFDKLYANNQAWVLSRIKIQFDLIPCAGDTITIRTFPKGIQQKIFFTRDYQLSDANGDIFARATSAWLLIDFEARKMLLPSALKHELPAPVGYTGLDELLEKIPIPESMEPLHTVKASYNTIDIMGHVNNTNYIEWVTDCFPLEFYKNRKINWVQINYANEVKPGEIVCLHRGQKLDSPNTWVITGINQTTNQRSFEAAIEWSSPDQITTE